MIRFIINNKIELNIKNTINQNSSKKKKNIDLKDS